MTKKHYEAIAHIIEDETTIIQHEGGDTSPALWKEETARRLADYFEQDNPKFNRTMFLTACGIEQS